MATADALPTLDELLDQERRLVFATLDENDAVALGLSLLRGGRRPRPAGHDRDPPA